MISPEFRKELLCQKAKTRKKKLKNLKKSLKNNFRFQEIDTLDLACLFIYNSEIAIRRCSVVSRSRIVTALSVKESKSITTQ